MLCIINGRTDKPSTKNLKTDVQRETINIYVGEIKKLLLSSSVFLLLLFLLLATAEEQGRLNLFFLVLRRG
jgi:hypothetical protein